MADALASRLDLSDPARVRRELAGVIDDFVGDFLSEHGLNVTREERRRLVDGVLFDAAGFGPIEPYLADDTVTEVMVNGPGKVYVERAGKIDACRCDLPG